MLISRLYLLSVVITLLLVNRCVRSVIQSACQLTGLCTCVGLKLTCSCKGQSQLLELKQDGYGFLPDGITSISVENCQDVIVFQQSIEKIRSLRQLTLKNIANLVLHEKSLSWDRNLTWQGRNYDPIPGINVEVVNCNIGKIPNRAFSGHIDSIYLENSKIDNVESFAFSSLDDMEKIKLKNCRVANFQQHSFKKFVVNHFVIEGGRMGVMSSYTVRDVIAKHDVRFENVNFGIVKTLAVTVEGPTALRIQGCLFELIESEAFKINTRGPVFIDDNIIRDLKSGAFIGITLDGRYHLHSDKQELVFDNNTLTKFNSGGLIFNTTGLTPKIDRLVLDVQCSCTDIKNGQTKLVKYHGVHIFEPNLSKETWCKDGKKELTIDQYYNDKCKISHTTVYLIIGLTIGALILIIFCVVGIRMYRKWKKMYKTVKNSTNENRLSTYSNTSNHIIVLPPAKSYLETEIDACDEEVEPLNSQNDVSKLKVTGL